MGVIPWGTMIYQLAFFVILIGVPLVLIVLIRFFRNRTRKIKDLEQRIQQLENKQQK